MQLSSVWSGTSCCDDTSGDTRPPEYDGPQGFRSPHTPLMRKYRFVAVDSGGGELPAFTSGPGHVYDSPLLREPADVTSFVGSHNAASISS